MASALRNISVLISPRFRTPLTPTKSGLGTPKPRSDGKLYHHHEIIRPNVAKKLDFTENTRHKFTKDILKTTTKILPDIKFEKVPDIIIKKDDEIVDDIRFSIKGDKCLDINTPNKFDLAKNGFDNFKNRTRILGKGAFGTVFRGKNKGKTVAVKIINKNKCEREENALRLNHKNIIRTLEIVRNSEHQDYCLVIMEYLANCRNLQDILENFHEEHSDWSNVTTTELLKKFCLDITTGLDHCHNSGVMHLDLKPQNILVDSHNVCKICDFGNSANIEENLDLFKHNGTIMYTAPEILMAKKPTTKSDVYSLGIIFWQIKHRKNPFSNYDTNESIIYNVGKFNARPSCEDENTDVLTSIFTKCWQSNPELRPNTGQILRDLKKADCLC